MPGEPIAVISETPTGATEVTPIASTETETEDFEVTREWVESLFANVVAALGTMAGTLGELSNQHNRMLEMLVNLESRLPANLTEMISNQQATITSLIAQGQETTREILRSTLTPPAPQTPPREPPSDGEDQRVPVIVEPETVVPAPAPPKRRKI